MDFACFRSDVNPLFSKPQLSLHNFMESIPVALLVWLLNGHERVSFWDNMHCSSSKRSRIPN